MSTSLDKLRQAMESASPAQGDKKSYNDDNYWKPELDKSGNGYAVVRFLPTPTDEEMPWVSYFDHGFQGPGGWYIEKSLTTIGKKDPVSDYNTQLWNTGIEANREQARKQKRRLHYVSNIYVVSDPKNPDNEGKVFMYRYGKKIFDKIMAAMQPEFEDETPINPFDFWEGANFKLKIRKVDGFWNYDKSEFDSVTALADSDEKLDGIWKTQYSLQEFLAPTNFKSYDELKKRLDDVLSGTVTASAASMVDEDVVETPQFKSEPQPNIPSVEEDDEDTMSYFQKLANE